MIRYLVRNAWTEEWRTRGRSELLSSTFSLPSPRATPDSFVCRVLAHFPPPFVPRLSSDNNIVRDRSRVILLDRVERGLLVKERNLLNPFGSRSIRKHRVHSCSQTGKNLIRGIEWKIRYRKKLFHIYNMYIHLRVCRYNTRTITMFPHTTLSVIGFPSNLFLFRGQKKKELSSPPRISSSLYICVEIYKGDDNSHPKWKNGCINLIREYTPIFVDRKP